MIELIEYRGREYPSIQIEGNAAQYAIPYAQKFCKGTGVDVGCYKKEWAFPGAIRADVRIDNEWTATNLPNRLDYIFSSHCLEHLDDYVSVMEYWYKKLKNGGVLFLYLPHYDQVYWRPWNNRNHKHVFNQEIIKDLLVSLGYRKPLLSSGYDLNHSFMAVAEK